ncbi:hypothetical protein KUTeg_015636 [Tegillarca granosa]|uniref:Uncharacterized protein n=1 Tax=Tegillarca granosa TaxID=220873 RepID=A0ABQ9EQM4_TEGGR|nr:hypothetical protein KUTeg_015636 [Tegillarca granosa]
MNFIKPALITQVNIFITAFYDAFIVYANVLNETLLESGNYLDGINMNRKIWGRTFEGINIK